MHLPKYVAPTNAPCIMMYCPFTWLFVFGILLIRGHGHDVELFQAMVRLLPWMSLKALLAKLPPLALL